MNLFFCLLRLEEDVEPWDPFNTTLPWIRSTVWKVNRLLLCFLSGTIILFLTRIPFSVSVNSGRICLELLNLCFPSSYLNNNISQDLFIGCLFSFSLAIEIPIWSIKRVCVMSRVNSLDSFFLSLHRNFWDHMSYKIVQNIIYSDAWAWYIVFSHIPYSSRPEGPEYVTMMTLGCFPKSRDPSGIT